MTGEALLVRCFQNIGILAPGESLSADDAAVGLGDLQSFIDSLGIKRQTMFAWKANVGTLISGQQTYTIGSGGNFNFARPQWIDWAKCRQAIAGGQYLETDVAILTQRQYADIPVKAITTGIVTACFYDRTWTAGLGNIVVYPYPNISGLALVLYGPVPVANYTDLATDVTAPPGYADMLEYNVSKRLTLKYPKGNISPLLLDLARTSLNAVLSSNVQPEVLGMDAALVRRSSVGRGYWDVVNGT